jgi:hypothetical protein
VRRLLGFLILFGALALILRHLARLAFDSVRGGSGPRRTAPGGSHRRGELVRDKVCNTFLPRERALRRGTSDGILYFCSERCLERHTSGADGPTGDGNASRIASTSPS